MEVHWPRQGSEGEFQSEGTVSRKVGEHEALLEMADCCLEMRLDREL